MVHRRGLAVDAEQDLHIIYYGLDLADYIDREFGDPAARHTSDAWHPRATVEFWRDLV